LQTGVMVQFHH